MLHKSVVDNESFSSKIYHFFAFLWFPSRWIPSFVLNGLVKKPSAHFSCPIFFESKSQLPVYKNSSVARTTSGLCTCHKKTSPSVWYMGVSKNNGTTKVMILFEARVRKKSLEREYLSAYNPGKLWSKDNILWAWKLSSHLDWRPQIWASLDRGVKGLAESVQCFQHVVTIYM